MVALPITMEIYTVNVPGKCGASVLLYRYKSVEMKVEGKRGNRPDYA